MHLWCDLILSSPCALGEWSWIRGMLGCPMWRSDWSSQPQESPASQQSNQRTWTQTLSKHNHTQNIPWVLEEILKNNLWKLYLSYWVPFFIWGALVCNGNQPQKQNDSSMLVFEVKGRLEKTQITQVTIWFLNWRISECHLENFLCVLIELVNKLV